MRICKHCKQEFDLSDKPLGWMANHSRWCLDNPKRKEYMSAIDAMNFARKTTGITNQFSKSKIEGTPIPSGTMKGRPGTMKGKFHSDATKVIQKEKALASPHRRLRRKMIEYNGVMLDSSWELELAKRLDSLNVEWIRPEPLLWIDENNVNHHYFSDFYLPKYDLYLDPKNLQAIKVQKEKLDCLIKQYDNILILTTIEECKNYTPS